MKWIKKEFLKRRFNRYFTRHQYQEILEQIPTALHHHPKDVHFLIFQIWAQIELEHFELAFHTGQKALEKHPENQVLLNLYAQAAFKLGKIKQARQTLENVLAQTPDNLHSSYLLGQIYVSEGDLDKACKYFEPILQYDPKILQVRLLAMAERSIFEAQIKKS